MTDSLREKVEKIIEDYKKKIHGNEYDYHCKMLTLEHHKLFIEKASSQATNEILSLFLTEEEVEGVIQTIFDEEYKHKGNFLCESKFWIRKRVVGGCNSGDQYSEPNIKGIAQALASRIPKGEKEYCDCKVPLAYMREGVESKECWKCGKPIPEKKECEHEWNFCGTGGTTTSINNDYICKKCGKVKKEIIPLPASKRVEELEEIYSDNAEYIFNILGKKLNEVISELNKLKGKR